MKKISILFLCIVSLFALISCFSESIISVWASNRFSKVGLLGSDRYLHGDLFGLSYLPQFKNLDKKFTYCTDIENPKIAPYNLYILGDSYLGSGFIKDKSVFVGVENLTYNHFDNREKVEWEIDTSKFNLLLIERAERYIHRFSDTNHLDWKYQLNERNNGTVANLMKHNTLPKGISNFFQYSNEYLFNPMLESNIEFLLFDYRFFTPVKELKAWFNHTFFSRTNKDVVISKDNNYLFLNETIDSTNRLSAFFPYRNDDVVYMVKGLNRLTSQFKAMGFDTVVLSIIPNPVSVLDPARGLYNNLPDRILKHTEITKPTLNVLDTFRKAPCKLFYSADSHWNQNGFKIWLNEYNQLAKDIVHSK
jgi:hypothetical protein